MKCAPPIADQGVAAASAKTAAARPPNELSQSLFPACLAANSAKSRKAPVKPDVRPDERQRATVGSGADAALTASQKSETTAVAVAASIDAVLPHVVVSRVAERIEQTLAQSKEGVSSGDRRAATASQAVSSESMAGASGSGAKPAMQPTTGFDDFVGAEFRESLIREASMTNHLAAPQQIGAQIAAAIDDAMNSSSAVSSGGAIPAQAGTDDASRRPAAGPSVLIVKLEPEALGPVVVRFRTVGGETTVGLEARDIHTSRILEGARADIAGALGRVGVAVSEINIIQAPARASDAGANVGSPRDGGAFGGDSSLGSAPQQNREQGSGCTRRGRADEREDRRQNTVVGAPGHRGWILL